MATSFLAGKGVPEAAALRQRISQTFFIPDPRPRLDSKTYGQFEPEPGIVADRVTYATEFGMRVSAIVYHQKDTGVKRPALIVVNGHGGDKYTWYAFYTGILYARAGGVVLTYDPAGEGERNRDRKSGTRQHDVYEPPEENGRRMAGLMITDIEQAVSYLQQRTDVDPQRIGAAGYSMGSFIGSLACALETRLHACALVGGGYLDGPDGYWDSSSKKMCQSIPYRSLSFLGDRPAVLFALNAERGPTLIHNGSADEMVAIPSHGEDFFRDMRERTIQKLGDAKNVFTYSFTPGGGHRPYFVTKPVGIWLNEQLHFPNWEAISRDETKIGDWAQANGVPIDKAYATEHRESGTMALGKNVTYVRRDTLNVVPESEWQEQKDKFALEGWFEQVRHVSSARAR